MKYIVGAYVTCPCLWHWEEKLADSFWGAIKSIDSIGGLEHAFWGTLHPYDDEWFLRMLKPEWDIVLTCVPGTMAKIKERPGFGLASADESGRRAAIQFTRDALESVVRINRSAGRQAVKAVQMHSAPSSQGLRKSTSIAFRQSLEELSEWDWEGAKLNIEHCDAWQENLPAEKGFLPLSDEIETCLRVRERTGIPWGMVINWGRSALEGRSTETPVKHVRAAVSSGVLSAVMFSGCGAKDNPWGIWQDSHMPPASGLNCPLGAQDSLMDEQSMGACLGECSIRELDYLGIKIMDLPNTSSIERRVELNRSALEQLDFLTANTS
jgi:hypothetical protein